MSIGQPLNNNAFQEMLSNYAPFYALCHGRYSYASDSTYQQLSRSMGKHDVVVVGIHGMNHYACAVILA